MDTKEKDYDADAALAELRESLKNINEPKSTIESEAEAAGLDISGYDWGSTGDTITLSNFGSGTYSNTVISGGYSSGTGAINPGPFTISGAGINYPNSIWTTTASNSASNSISGQLNLEGKDADVKINGWSLSEAINRLEERLNILNINPELENEWAELKELGDKYRALEAKLKEQGEMWAKLKSMPPPDPLY